MMEFEKENSTFVSFTLTNITFMQCDQIRNMINTWLGEGLRIKEENRQKRDDELEAAEEERINKMPSENKNFGETTT